LFLEKFKRGYIFLYTNQNDINRKGREPESLHVI